MGVSHLVIDNLLAFLVKVSNDPWATFIEYGHNFLGLPHYVLVTLGLDSFNLDEALELSSLRDGDP